MSRLITNTEQLEPIPAIKNTIRKISFNPQSFRSSSLPLLTPQHIMTQQLFLNNICKHINDSQRQSIRIKAHQEAQQQLCRLKGKLRKNVRKQNINIIMGENKKTSKNVLGSVMKVPTENIQIDKKYHKNISMKLSLLNEAQGISAYKDSYNKWYDTSKNSPTHSPIYNRINFLLEKVAKSDQSRVICANNVRKSMDGIYQRPNGYSYYRLNRKKTDCNELRQKCK